MQEDIRQKIKKITIYTKRLMQSELGGDYLSAFKGYGLEFDQLREYQMGDDVRFIDWNSSAKMNKIMIKQFIEERDRTVILAIDISASSQYSSSKELRSETIAQVTAALAFIATNSKDKVGAVFFSDRIEKWIAPTRGQAHYGKIIDALFTIKPRGKKTSFIEVLRFLINLKKRNAVVFMLSDWIENNNKYTKLLSVASCKYDFIAVRVTDKCEHKLPNIGLLDIQDPESGKIITIKAKQSAPLNIFLETRTTEQKRMFEKHRIDILDLTVGKPFINDIVRFFHQRIRRQI